MDEIGILHFNINFLRETLLKEQSIKSELPVFDLLLHCKTLLILIILTSNGEMPGICELMKTKAMMFPRMHLTARRESREMRAELQRFQVS